jgi:hypothetical protein
MASGLVCASVRNSEQELERLAPPVDPDLDEAVAVLADFARFWTLELSAAERRNLLATLFDRVWEQGGAITAVKPRAAFARYFRAVEAHARHPTHAGGAEGGSDGGQTHVRHRIEFGTEREPRGSRAAL